MQSFGINPIDISSVSTVCIQHSCLIAKNISIYLYPIRDLYEKRIFWRSMGYWAYHYKWTSPICDIVANYERGSSSLLFMSRLRVAININDISLINH